MQIHRAREHVTGDGWRHWRWPGCSRPPPARRPTTTPAPTRRRRRTTTTDRRAPAGYAGHTSAIYADDANWLCKPGIADDVCSRDLDATAVAADGSTEVIEHEAADDPPVDCFYVYPTTSRDPGPNSDLVPAKGEEIFTAYNQVARLTSTCRVYAPVYRQVTCRPSRRGGGGFGGRPPGGRLRRCRRRLQALRRQRERRPRVRAARPLPGRRDDHPADPGRDRRRAAPARPPGGGVRPGVVVAGPRGRGGRGDFAKVPLCEAEDQTGCVVTYSSYRSTDPPAGGLFGRDRDGMVPPA